MDCFNLLMISLSALSTVRGAAPLCCRGQQYIGKNYQKSRYRYFSNKSLISESGILKLSKHIGIKKMHQILFDKYMESQTYFNIFYLKNVWDKKYKG